MTGRIIKVENTYPVSYSRPVDPINGTSHIEIRLVFHFIRCRIVMIMTTLVVIREAVRVLHAEIQARIVRMKHRQTDQGSRHVEIPQPFVDRLPRLERRLTEVRHDVKIRLALPDNEDAAQADRPLAVLGLQRPLDRLYKVHRSRPRLGHDLEHLPGPSIASEQVRHQAAVLRRTLLADTAASPLVVDLGIMRQVRDFPTRLPAYIGHEFRVHPEHVKGAGARTEKKPLLC